jgi:uncharacterized membrane protein
MSDEQERDAPRAGWLARVGFGLIVFSMLGGALGHVLAPEGYAPLVPPFIPLALANWTAFFCELVVGVLLLVPRTRALGGLAFFALMLAFLPLHVWDLFKEAPAMGSSAGAAIRLIMQGALIWGGWKIFQHHREPK